MIRRAKKKHMLSSQIIDMGKDTKELFSLINKMTECKKPNPLPPSTCDKELAEEFATSFMNKIKKIWDAPDAHPKFKPYWQIVCKPFDKLHSAHRRCSWKCPYVHTLKILWIGCTANQSAEEDHQTTASSAHKNQSIISWRGFSRGMDGSHNLSTTQEGRTGSDMQNYRPVSNLSFLSKVMEKVH